MRTWNDLQALAMPELAGRERPGTVVAELTGAPIPAFKPSSTGVLAEQLDSVQDLIDLIQRLAADKSTKNIC